MSEPRFDPLPPDEWSDLLRTVVENTSAGPDRPMNIFTTIARHGELFDSWVRFGSRLLTRGALPARDRELAILRTATNTGSRYEWAQHVRIGRAAGLSDEEIEAAARPLDEHDWGPGERLVLEAADELHRTSDLSDSTWSRLAARYEERQLIEFPLLVGHYVMVAFALNSLRVQIEE
jgi:AhpD family alkylhydroperoxidase